MILLTTACSHLHKDGPPRWYVDVSKIPNATPRIEPRSRTGNAPKYRVHGKTYHVRPTSKYFKQRGIASWYGTKFHSKLTSSGEVYNMLAMTAAHKSLPLPTYVKVTNLNNKKQVIVKVNDRGPFARGRIIDLSYAAAKKIGMTKKGTAYVEITAIDPKKYRATHRRFHNLSINTGNFAPVFSATAKPKKNNVYFLQIASFKNRKFAEKLQQRMKRYLHTKVKISQTNNHKTHYYKVEIGPIHNIKIANSIQSKLKTSAGIKHSFIIRHRT